MRAVSAIDHLINYGFCINLSCSLLDELRSPNKNNNSKEKGNNKPKEGDKVAVQDDSPISKANPLSSDNKQKKNQSPVDEERKQQQKTTSKQQSNKKQPQIELEMDLLEDIEGPIEQIEKPIEKSVSAKLNTSSQLNLGKI